MSMDQGAAVKSSANVTITKQRLLMVGGLALSLASLSYTLRETWASLFDMWIKGNDYGHGLLVAPLIIYLLWLRRHDLAQVPIRPSVLGLLISFGLILIWMLSSLLGVLIGEQLALVLLLLSIPLAVAGWAMLKVCALPVLMLLVTVPMWNYLNPILQANTASAATALVRLVGVPVFNEGVYLTIPGGRFLVAEVCSGMRYLLASMTLGALFAIVNLSRARYRLLLLISSFFLSMVFNWIRVAIIVSAGHYLGMDSSLVHRHLWLGWVLFGVAAALLVWFGNGLQNREARHSRVSATMPLPALGSEQRRTWLSGLYAVLCSLALGLGSGFIAAPDTAANGGALTLNLRALSVPGYERNPALKISDWQASFLNPDAAAQTVFLGEGPPVGLYVAYYRQQHQGAEVVNDSNSLFDREVWRRTSVQPRPERIEITPQLHIEEFQIIRKQGSGHLLLWRLYWVGGAFVGNGVGAKYRQIISLIQGNKAAAGIVLAVPVKTNPELSRQQLQNFLKATLAPLGNYLSSLR